MSVRTTRSRYRQVPNGGDTNEDVEDNDIFRPSSPVEQLRHLDDATDNSERGADHCRLRSASIESYCVKSDDRPARSESSGSTLQSERPFLSGWRVGAMVSLVGTTLVCIFNVAITTYVWTGPYEKSEGAVGTLFSGSCARTRELNVWIHLVVNVLSTLLLAASNYCMQVLSAPNREELVQAHGRRIWLHIGVPSPRNLWHIGRHRAALWVVLFLSSMPLHLFFNSVVFTNLQANEYFVNPVTEEWMNGGGYNLDRFRHFNTTRKDAFIAEINGKGNLTLVGEEYINSNNPKATYQKLDAEACFNKYKDQYMSDAGNLYIVHDGPIAWRNLDIWWPEFHSDKNFTWTKDWRTLNVPVDKRGITEGSSLPFMSRPDIYPSNAWRCPSHSFKTCDVENEYEVPKNRSAWQPYQAPIKYCLMEEVHEFCRLQFSFQIATVVVVSNFIKAVCMALTLFMYRRHQALVTLGDAISHFLDHPDPETQGRCLFSRHLMEAQWKWERFHGAGKDELGVTPEPFDPERRSWQRAPSGKRWLATYVLYIGAIIFAIVCMTRTLKAMPKDLAKLWDIGFGTIAGNNLLNVGTSLIGGILLANLPQAVLSYLYLTFNALYTNMFVGKEWSSYYAERKALRVTSPVGQQRATYWLNVPFRYAIPMTVMSGVFHWLASQSIFLVQITVIDAYTREPYRKISTCGYSPVAIILCTALGTIIALGGCVIGQFKYAPGMPVAGSCSAAISAACHPLLEDTEASTKPVQWGAVTHGEQDDKEEETVGHCTFSSFPIHPPIPGHLYA